NLIPNIVFEIVAGGALASLVVPLLAGAIAVGDRAAVARTTSALLTWVGLGLAVLAVVLAVAARPVIGAIAGDSSPEQVEVGAGEGPRTVRRAGGGAAAVQPGRGRDLRRLRRGRRPGHRRGRAQPGRAGDAGRGHHRRGGGAGRLPGAAGGAAAVAAAAALAV